MTEITQVRSTAPTLNAGAVTVLILGLVLAVAGVMRGLLPVVYGTNTSLDCGNGFSPSPGVTFYSDAVSACAVAGSAPMTATWVLILAGVIAVSIGASSLHRPAC